MTTIDDVSRCPAATPRRRQARATATRSALLDAALTEFAAHGFEGASTRRIAAAAGTHQPQINYHFESKEELWQAAVDHLFDRLDHAVAELLGEIGPAGAAGRDSPPTSARSSMPQPGFPSSTASWSRRRRSIPSACSGSWSITPAPASSSSRRSGVGSERRARSPTSTRWCCTTRSSEQRHSPT